MAILVNECYWHILWKIKIITWKNTNSCAFLKTLYDLIEVSRITTSKWRPAHFSLELVFADNSHIPFTWPGCHIVISKTVISLTVTEAVEDTGKTEFSIYPIPKLNNYGRGTVLLLWKDLISLCCGTHKNHRTGEWLYWSWIRFTSVQRSSTSQYIT